MQKGIYTGDKPVYAVTKRVVDIVFSMLGLILLIPVFLVIVSLIKFEEPAGPVLFVQKRVGKNNQEFNMYKFRSMRVDAEEQLAKLLKDNEVTGAMFKMKNDPRVTRVGRFIRKTSLDELPQLYNVLIGKMSLVGPRPPLRSEVEKYTARDMQRLAVKPGCSGLWQVSGRNELSFDEMVDLDLKYIAERSIKFDFLIMAKTVFQMFNPQGAY